MRTVIYARFSSTLQNARSTDDQIALCRERCVREGWEIVGVYRDEAISGAAGIDESSRPGLNALLEHVESGDVDQVLAEATDRIARHQGDAYAIRERVTFAGARIFTLSDGEDGLFTKPAVADYPAYLQAACAGDPNGSCTTIHYKSATRAHIESLGYDIVANFGDQDSDLTGGFADRTFKLPNPNYYLP